MPTIESTWLIGSRVWASAIDVTIDASAEQISAGTYFLRSATTSESLLARLEAAMTSAGVADASADITEAGYVVLSSSGTFTVTWTDTVLRNVLGFTADLSAASSYVATYKSELFWSPGYVATRPAPNSVGGVDMNDTRIQISRDGTQRNVVSHHTRRFDTLSWDAVWHERVWYADSAQDNTKGGTWRRFRERVWALGRTFDVYLVVDETAGSTTTATWPSALGRYLCRELPPGDPPRKHQQMQTLWNLSVETHEWS